MHPHTQERRPITFHHDVAKGRDDVVLVHLNHRLVQMSLRLLRAEVWAQEDAKRLYRVTIRSVPDDRLDAPAVVVWSRLVVTGAKSHRLHEEVTHAGGLVRDGRFARLNVTQSQELLDGSEPVSQTNGLPPEIQRNWPQLETSILGAVEARTRDRMRYLENTLGRRRDREIQDITNVLEELRASIEQQMKEPENGQLQFWATEEQLQFERNRDSLKDRLASIPKEIRDESLAIRERYADPVARTFPAAITLLMPQSMVGGAR